jgi:hypothetical protein
MTTTTPATHQIPALRDAWAAERAAARAARTRADPRAEWTHLERAHILSQPMALRHVRTHLDMLSYGVRRRDGREIVGQLIRLVGAAPGSWTRRYPVGNTGGANVNALLVMPIPEDLRLILEPLTPMATLTVTHRSVRAPVVWGLVFGAAQLTTPLAIWWLDAPTVLALLLAMIAGVYIGFAVADGRPKVIAVESAVTGGFVILAAIAVTGSVWVLVAGYAGHGLKDYLQQRHHYVANTRWWPPFCAAVDWLVAAGLILEIGLGVDFR